MADRYCAVASCARDKLLYGATGIKGAFKATDLFPSSPTQHATLRTDCSSNRSRHSAYRRRGVACIASPNDQEATRAHSHFGRRHVPRNIRSGRLPVSWNPVCSTSVSTCVLYPLPQPIDAVFFAGPGGAVLPYPRPTHLTVEPTRRRDTGRLVWGSTALLIFPQAPFPTH